MGVKNKKTARRFRVKAGIRRRVSGTESRPRLTVFRSNKNVYAQLVDDVKGVTLAAASSLEKDISGGSTAERCKAVGARLAERAKEAGVSVAVFDRNGFTYHGRVKALADGAREGGLNF